MIEIDPSSPVPLYLQIADEMRRLIAMGALKPGDKVPAVRELAVTARVNRNTAARAIQHLEAEGVVRARVGQGTFVEEAAPTIDRTRRDRAIDALLDKLIAEAQTNGLPLDDLRRRLERRVKMVRSGGGGDRE